MLPEAPWLVKCPTCHGLFWIDEAKKLGQFEPLRAQDDKWPSARAYEKPTLEEYLQYVTTTGLSLEKERYIRIRAWWCSNDVRRDVGHLNEDTQPFSGDELTNLEKLGDLLSETEPVERLTKAEILRERGLFEEAISLLDFPFPKDFSNTAQTIRSLCEAKATAVAEIKYECDRTGR